MNLQEHISAFSELGLYIQNSIQHSSEEIMHIYKKAEAQNSWFTVDNCLFALQNIADSLQKDSLEKWLLVNSPNNSFKNIAVIMAGNIPLVGFHDALCVLISGKKLQAKLSSKDTVLMTYILQKLIEIEPRYYSHIHITQGILENFDAVISTGSNNSSQYFEYYFNKYPHIIRKHRNSIGIITEHTTDEELQLFTHDIFHYFGLGCRNISKLYIHENFDITRICNAFEIYHTISSHNKYMNNYEYTKSIYLLSKIPHFDTGFSMLKEDVSLNSPISVVYFEKYSNFAELQKNIQKYSESIQCIVSTTDMFYKKNTLPGMTQCPELWEYADDINTITFLNNL